MIWPRWASKPSRPKGPTFKRLSRSMRSGIERAAMLLLAAVVFASVAWAGALRERVLKDRAKEAGLTRAADVMPLFSPERSAAGRLLFESKELSLSQEIACKNCHLDRFGSA